MLQLLLQTWKTTAPVTAAQNTSAMTVSMMMELLSPCGFCKRNYCSDCAEITICGICGVGGRCSGCEDRSCCWECSYSRCALCLCKCERCDMSKCRGCAPNIECDICERVICEDCSDGSTYSLKRCDDCCSTLCSHCRVGDCKIEGKGAC